MKSEQSLWRIIGRVLQGAPPGTKFFVTLTPLILLVLTAVAVVDLVGSQRPGAGLRIWGVIFSNTGLALWSLAAVLHAVSESKPGKEAANETDALFSRIWMRLLWFTAKAVPERAGRAPQDVVRVLPVISLIASCLLAAGAGMLIPAIPESPALAIPAVISGFSVILAIRTVRDTIRFLLNYGREQAKEAADARRHASEAQLAALQAQLNPHFLFNALNTVAALVRQDPSAAEATVDHLAHVLRRTLDRSSRQFSTVDDELDYLKAYLGVERERFGERLKVEWNVDAATKSCRIPTMTLQPLVENSLKHGIGGRLDGGTITISAKLDDGVLQLRVADDGAGFLPRYREGTGLRNLRERLVTLYGDEATLGIGTNGSGAQVTVRIEITNHEQG